MKLLIDIWSDDWDVDFVPECEGHAYVEHDVIGPCWIIEDFMCSTTVIPTEDCNTSIPFKFFIIFNVFCTFDSILVIDTKIW